MNKQFNHKTLDSKWIKTWDDDSLFKCETIDKDTYILLQPPPNRTGMLHIGHAYNNTLQDILIRTKMLNGYKTVWIPGTDHGGIATQSTAEKIKKKRLSKDEIKEFSEEKRDIINDQFKKLGLSCDWSREQYTMNDAFSKKVQECFIHFYEHGMIYKGKKIVNWCKKCYTTLSDEEVNEEEISGKMYYIRYQLEEGGDIIIGTTRPETLFGDAAIGINPKDERCAMLNGKSAIIPLINKKIKILEDYRVKPDYGTGIMKLTPCHDKLDEEIGNDHCLDKIEIINLNCKIFNTGTKFDGMDRFDCRKLIAEELQKNGYLVKTVPHKLKIKKCYRCETIIEPLYSDQWYLKMTELTNKMKTDTTEYLPDYHKKILYEWFSKDKDWCLSRQIKWGHSIPMYQCGTCDESTCGINIKECKNCGSNNIYQETSVLDTWFSSGCWAMCSIDESEKIAYPMDILITGKDILYHWVARMMMLSSYFDKKAPFKKVLLHGLIRDKNGDKMSKSKGNIINPLDIIDKHGLDALRYTLIFNSRLGDDMKLSLDSFKAGSKFCTKLWNACRFLEMQPTLEQQETTLEKFTEFRSCKEKYKEHMSNFDFGLALMELTNYFWNTYCSDYLEEAKTDATIIPILKIIMMEMLRLYHPFVPVITAELWCQFSDTPIIEKLL